MSDVKHDHMRSKLAPMQELQPGDINALFDQLMQQAREELYEEGFSDEAIRLTPFLDLRYAGQGYEITVPCPPAPLKPEDMELVQQRFHEVHEQAHGHKAESEPVELVSVRLVSEGRVPQTRLSPFTPTGANVADARTGERRIFFGRDLGFQACPIYDRDRLEPGHELDGPAVVEQMDTTTVIHPEQQARVDDYKNLIITAKG